MEWVPEVVRYIAVICIAVLCAIILGKIFQYFYNYLKKNEETSNLQPATVAALLSVLILFFIGAKKIEKLDALNKFLSAITDNFFAFIIVAIASFLIFHIAYIILFDLIFPKDPCDDISKLISKYVKKIEKSIVIFSCKMLSGIVSIFDFIPDFFNTIGSVLLDREDLFPEDKEIDDNEKIKGK